MVPTRPDYPLDAPAGRRLGWLLGGWLLCRTLAWTVVTWLSFPNAPLAQLQLVNDGAGNYYSPIQRTFDGGLYEDVTDLNGGIAVYANGSLCSSGTGAGQYTLTGPGLALNGFSVNYAGPINFRTGAAGPNGDDGKSSKEVQQVVPAENRWGAFLTGTGQWEHPAPTYRLSDILRHKGIRHSLDDWGPQGGHDWPYWKNEMREYLGRPAHFPPHQANQAQP